jgi:RNA 2',3'-cyclic 3'-phosphodiesterase
MRTFIGICFSVGTTRRIAEAMEKKAAELSPLGWKLAWVPPGNLHVTLKFLGSIPPESLDAITLGLRRRIGDLPAPVLRARGLGAFPIEARLQANGGEPSADPRVLWVGAEGGKPLEAVQRMVELEMAELGFAKEARPYHPHVTVARVVEPPPAEHRGAFLAGGEALDFGEDRIPEIVVFESRSIHKANRAGVEYLAKARVPFTK